MTANPLSTIPPIGPTTGMAAPQAASKFKPIDPVRLLRQNLPLIILSAVVGLIIGGGAWFAMRQFAPSFGSEAKLAAFGTLTQTDGMNLGGTESSQLAEIETFIRNQMAVITSDDMLREAIAYPSVRNTQWFQQYNGDIRLAAKALEEDHLRVYPQRDSTLMVLNMRMRNGDDARTVLDALIAVYLTSRQRSLAEDTGTLTTMHTRELERAQEELRRLENDRSRYIIDNNLATVQIQHSEASIAYETLNRQRVAMEMELQAASTSIAGLLQANEEDPNRAMTESEEQILRQFMPVAEREELIRYFTEQIRTMKAMGYGDGHRTIREMNERIASTEQELDELMVRELGKLRAGQVSNAMQMQEQIALQIEDMRQKTEAVHERMRDMTRTLATFDNIEKNIEAIRDQIVTAQQNLAELRKYQTRQDATRVTRAVNPTEAELVSPMWYVWIPGITLLCVGSVVGLLFLREVTDQRVNSPADVKLLHDATLLGVLPDGDEDPSGQTKVNRAVETTPTGLMAESFRQVRTSVLSRMDRRGYKTLVLVGAQPEAGTSSVAQNLASSLAYNGRNVLIIDGNFRRPMQHTLAEISNARGLVDVLRDKADAAEVIHKNPNLSLSVLPTGQAAEVAPELLEGPAFRSLLGRLESEYDIVILDAPPALLTSDAQLLAKHVDAIAVVVRAGTDKRGMVERMFAKLDGQRADVLGVILNGVKSASGGYFRKSYEDFYNYRRVSDEKTASSNGKSNGKRHGKQAPSEVEAS